MKVKPYPRARQVYLLRDIIEKLRMDDTPCLLYLDDPVCHSHITNEQLLSVPGMAETRWEYRYTTNEWVPVFVYAGDVKDLPVDVEPHVDRERRFWITPKGFPYPQDREAMVCSA